MGWELRSDEHWYLYRNRRVNGRPVKEYLVAASAPYGFGELMGHELARLQRREEALRQLRRRTRLAYRCRLDDLLRVVTTANAELRGAVHGVLSALGFHRHHRGEWRMRRERRKVNLDINRLKDQEAAGVKPLLSYSAPTGDGEAAELFSQARGGNVEAKGRLSELVRDRKWQEWLGNLGYQATRQLIVRAAGGDPVCEAGVTEKARAMQLELLGESPTVLEKLLVRRVVNGWIATHALELELTVRPPAEPRDRAHLDRALSRAQKRLTDAARELARVRRLRLPQMLDGFYSGPHFSDRRVSYTRRSRRWSDGEAEEPLGSVQGPSRPGRPQG